MAVHSSDVLDVAAACGDEVGKGIADRENCIVKKLGS